MLFYFILIEAKYEKYHDMEHLVIISSILGYYETNI